VFTFCVFSVAVIFDKVAVVNQEGNSLFSVSDDSGENLFLLHVLPLFTMRITARVSFNAFILTGPNRVERNPQGANMEHTGARTNTRIDGINTVTLKEQ